MSARVVLYVRPGCHLCEPAREIVAAECAAVGIGFDEVDIDAVGGDVRARLTDLVPVVEVDGNQVGYWRIRAENVRTALTRDGGQ